MMKSRNAMRPAVSWSAALLAVAMLTGGAQAAAPIGDVEFVRGAGAAQRPGQAARVLGSGSPVEEGEVLTTGANGFAVVKLNDGTRMSLRPNTAMKIDEFILEQPGRNDNLVMHLLKGGLRLVTGSIGKRVSTSRLVTSTATVGIRGTDFDARICADDCKAEARRPVSPVAQASANALVSASARVVQMQGGLTATGAIGERRLVTPGGRSTAATRSRQPAARRRSWCFATTPG